MKNLKLSSGYIANYFENYRNKYEDFYPSEKWAFEKINSNTNGFGVVLDVGCANGGLGLALSSHYNIERYDGIDINQQAIKQAKCLTSKYPMPVNFECEDILNHDNYKNNYYDNVFSLSCADWNIRTIEIINRCWKLVKPKGFFTISVRLTNVSGINDVSKSYQKLEYDKIKHEKANYVVFNWKIFLEMISGLREKPSEIYGKGYWGKPSSTAITPYKELVFSCFVIKKGINSKNNTDAHLSLPLDLIV